MYANDWACQHRYRFATITKKPDAPVSAVHNIYCPSRHILYNVPVPHRLWKLPPAYSNFHFAIKRMSVAIHRLPIHLGKMSFYHFACPTTQNNDERREKKNANKIWVNKNGCIEQQGWIDQRMSAAVKAFWLFYWMRCAIQVNVIRLKCIYSMFLIFQIFIAGINR